MSHPGCNKVGRAILLFRVPFWCAFYFPFSLPVLSELATQLIAQWFTLGTWIVNSPANGKFVVVLSQICLRVVLSGGVLAFFFFFHPQIQIGCVWSPTFTGKWRKYLRGRSEPQTRRRGNWGVCKHNFSNLPQHLHLVSSHFSHCWLNKTIVCFSLREKEVKVGHTVWSLIWGSNCIQAITSGRGVVVGEARVYRNNSSSASFTVCLRSHFLAPPRRIQRLILVQWDALLPRARLQSFSLDPKPKAILGARGFASAGGGRNTWVKNYRHGNFPPHSPAFPNAPL